MKNPALFRLLVVWMLPGFFLGCSGMNSTAEPPAQAASTAPAVPVETARVETRDLQRFVEAVGTLDPNEEVTVSNQVEGMLDELFVDLGDSVRPGQVIAMIDARELELAVKQQQAALQQEVARLGLTDATAAVDEATTSQVRQAEATFAEAKIRLDRTRKLVAEGVLPMQQLDEQQARFDVAEAALRSSRETVRNIRATISARKASLDLAEKKLADARITAPMAGLIQERQATQGQFLRVNSPIVTIVQNNPLKLRVDVPESAAPLVQVGRPVQFSVDAAPGELFEGRISRIAPSVDQQSRTLKVEVAVNNSGGRLKAGFFARAIIQTGREDKVLMVPADSILTTAGLERVFIVDGGKVVERLIRSGTRAGDEVEIVEGLAEGELIARSNLGSLQQGREVSVR